MLSLLQDGMERPIAFASRTLSRSERNYYVIRRELWLLQSLSSNSGITCKVQDSLFEVFISPCALSLKLRIQKDNWHAGLHSLSTFDFEIQYRPGKRHQNANALSRRPCDDRCRWCKGWRFHKQVSSVHVGV